MGHFDPFITRKEFELPDYLVPVAMLPIGYPAESSRPSHLHMEKLAPEKTIFYNSYEGVEPGNRECGAH